MTAASDPEPEPVRRAGKGWADRTPLQKAGVVALGTAQVVLLAAAVIDLVRRPPEQVRGPKWVWAPVLAVNLFGPVTYLACGRRR